MMKPMRNHLKWLLFVLPLVLLFVGDSLWVRRASILSSVVFLVLHAADDGAKLEKVTLKGFMAYVVQLALIQTNIH